MIVQLQISRRFVPSSTDHPSCYVPGPGRVTPSCSVSAWPRWLGHGDCDISAAVETFFRICSPQCEMTPAEIRTLRVRWKWRTWQKCSPTGLCLSSGKLVNVVGSAVTNIRSVLCVNSDIFQYMTSTPGLHYCLPASSVPVWVSKPNLVPSTLGRAEGRSAIAGKWSWVVWSAGAATATINTQSPSWMPCTLQPEHSTQVTVWKKAGFCQIFRWKM